MRSIIFLVIFMLVSPSVFAGFPPRTKCSNLDATVKIDVNDGIVTILTSISPQANYETISFDDLNISGTLVQEMPNQQRGKTSRTVSFKEITMQKKDGSSLPNAYNRLTEENGSLMDYFVCSVSRSWM